MRAFVADGYWEIIVIPTEQMQPGLMTHFYLIGVNCTASAMSRCFELQYYRVHLPACAHSKFVHIGWTSLLDTTEWTCLHQSHNETYIRKGDEDNGVFLILIERGHGRAPTGFEELKRTMKR